MRVCSPDRFAALTLQSLSEQVKRVRDRAERGVFALY
jgi:hypothetical protein